MEKPEKLKRDFMEEDFHDSLKWLFTGAITWHAHPLDKDHAYLRSLGMFTSLVHARALYEFFYKCGQSSHPNAGATASAKDFVASWNSPADRKQLYSRYMAKQKPAQRRVFHLVYGRGKPAGGSMGGGSAELNEQVLEFARDLRRLTEEFIRSLSENPDYDAFRQLAESALSKALAVGSALAAGYNIPMPL
ncbi:MAG TPA: hypothetical protein VJQ59_13685 [Candidatus Sulfotelmatobacter sp.]|nr:hypothetical protein [Candidatus Sulfotelmatobacter sp.]